MLVIILIPAEVERGSESGNPHCFYIEMPFSLFLTFDED